MSMSLMAKAMSIKVGNPLRKLVLIKLADNANDKGECWPSYQHIADHCECSKSAVRSHIDVLIEMGLLIKENRLGNHNGKGNASNVYYLNLSAAPMPPKSIPPVPPENRPVSSDDIPPMPPDGTRTSHSFEPVKEPAIDISEKSSRKTENKHSLPDSFFPTEQHQALASELGVNLQEEFLKFTDHHASKGTRFVDWGRALNTWLRNAKTYQREPQKNPTPDHSPIQKYGDYYYIER
ncbi:helix-turn-helix domain-containing protein [Xenorhabdus griffiniae]|uniref:helix-turn-helix domain-containing protein n=1 Tax=Xenorhabdus griffiniae TaxID=351672 RepID=UPI00235995E9|nr:helix-turn-helix domain-containing protein [Xenorhabdus griffiniae]MDC9604936.1 helix-turn-helix domain-containing protein [Xenorhabdus griffiniae]